MFPITDLEEGKASKVIEIIGGRGIHQKLDAFGIRVGVQVKKVSSLMLRGPVVITVGNTQIAIGRGMAQKIIVGFEK